MSNKPNIEKWKPIVGFVNYMVSTHGRVKSINQRKGGRANVNDGVLKGCVQRVRNGYARKVVTLRKDGRNHYKKVAAIVLEAFICPRPKGKVARHLNGNSLENNLTNLSWGTQKENCADSKKHGTFSPPPIHKGETHPLATISDKDVEFIRSHKFKRGDQASLAKKFGVAPITIRRIKLCLTRT